MLDTETLADVEGDASAAISAAGFDPSWDAPSVAELCVGLIGSVPRLVDGLNVGASWDGDEICVSADLTPERQRFKAAHELAHHVYRDRRFVGAYLEARCDALAAALVAPRAAFRRAIRLLGRHGVHALASAFHTTQSLALLRVGEVTGRPVALMRPAGTIARGEGFAWPESTSTLVRLARERPKIVHPLRITDEPNRVGLMLRWEAMG